ncbi:HD domain-containing phosphohydrolase [Salinibius halmophilus]|uniref:HD domain-containing phosphohydrolase n=1 Tax=Salinibius halmophilus TaxID=1853216 RepID=UPI000E672745|nr:HD domain-containing phosphohydrolase [Salinibius halmophilus]
MSDLFEFAAETPVEHAQKCPWRILVVDDDSHVIATTRLALTSFEFEGRDVELVCASSASEALRLLATDSDFAVVLLDVVMETEDAGLQLVSQIRDELQLSSLRIILRTGQPGSAPVQKVLHQYEINDYYHKTELSMPRLQTAVLSALRSYRDLVQIERSRQGMAHIVMASRNLLSNDGIQELIGGALTQLGSLFNFERAIIVVNEPEKPGSKPEVICGYGEFAEWEGSLVNLAMLPQPLQEKVKHGKDCLSETEYVACINGKRWQCWMYFEHKLPAMYADRQMVRLFAENVASALDTVRHNAMINEGQREIILRLSELIEWRSGETGSHVKRVSACAAHLGTLIGLDDLECDTLKLASPLHDLGKLGIPDSVLHKPDRLDREEWALMQGHSEMGYQMLAGTGLPLLDAGAEVAYTHHERWDGKGYPRGLVGEEIPLFGRITAIVDVFDALASERAYKPAWPTAKIVALLKAERGRHFDPNLVDLMLEHLDEFLAIRSEFPD